MKLISQERLDSTNGHTPGPWRFTDSGKVEVPADYRGPGYYNNPQILGSDGSKIAGEDEYYVFSGAPNVNLLLLAPELKAENEYLRRLLEDIHDHIETLHTHIHYAQQSRRFWHLQVVEEVLESVLAKFKTLQEEG